MKIAYILYPEVVISNRSNGVRSQAEMWAELLRAEGHSVDYVNNWSDYNWKSYDIIHLFGGGKWIYKVAKRLSFINPHIVWSPIIDPRLARYTYQKYSLGRWLQTVTRDKMQWKYSEETKALPYCARILTRTVFEGEFISRALGVPKDIIFKVPLSYSSSCSPYKPLRKSRSACISLPFIKIGRTSYV